MVFEGGFYFLKNTVIFDPIDRIWIFGGFSIFCPLRDGFICHILSMGLENDLFIFENPGILSTPGLLHTYICICVCACVFAYTCISFYL